MSLRTWLYRLLDRGEAVPPAPDSIVEVDNVWLSEGPILLSILEQAGIEAQGIQATNIATEATALTRMRIFVRQADLAPARAEIEEYGRILRETP